MSKPHLAGGIPVSATLDVLPSHPTVEDAITIVVGGIWSDSCVPYELATNRTEEMVLLSLITPPADVVCSQAYTPWSLKAELGKLSTGVYLIKVQGGLTMSKTLTVSTHLIYLPTVSNERSITE
ncbi:MAG: hypothetical protein KDE47_03245 [Caldilineaceae bacterium]|nr:hypothetical protein [Caldilineaceae bacterium]